VNFTASERVNWSSTNIFVVCSRILALIQALTRLIRFRLLLNLLLLYVVSANWSQVSSTTLLRSLLPSCLSCLISRLADQSLLTCLIVSSFWLTRPLWSMARSVDIGERFIIVIEFSSRVKVRLTWLLCRFLWNLLCDFNRSILLALSCSTRCVSRWRLIRVRVLETILLSCCCRTAPLLVVGQSFEASRVRGVHLF